MAECTQQNIAIPQASPALAMMQGAAYAYQLEQENKQLREQLYAAENPPDRLQKKVIVECMLLLLKGNGVSLANMDRTKIARLMSPLIGFSENGIMKVLENCKDYAPCHDEDLQRMNKLLSDVGLMRLGA